MLQNPAATIGIEIDLDYRHVGIQLIPPPRYAAQWQPDARRTSRLGDPMEAQQHIPARVHNAGNQWSSHF